MSAVRLSSYDAAFAGLWALALGALAVGDDRTDLVQAAVEGVIFGGLYVLTRRFTGAPAPLGVPRNAVLGAFVIALVLVLLLLESFWRDAGGLVGAWSQLHWGITARLLPAVRVLDPESLNSTVAYVLLPGIVLVALGWRASSLGLGPARRGALKALLAWCALPLVLYGAAAFAVGHGKPAALLHRFFIDVFRNGYAEEIFFRGMLMTVTVRALGVRGGNVAQALVFGGFHVGADLRDVHGIGWLACADAMATQALAGYFFGLLTLRTGNVGASGAAHALFDGGAVFA